MPADPTQDEAEFDEFAGDYDAELNKGLALSGESKEFASKPVGIRFAEAYLTRLISSGLDAVRAAEEGRARLTSLPPELQTDH